MEEDDLGVLLYKHIKYNTCEYFSLKTTEMPSFVKTAMKSDRKGEGNRSGWGLCFLGKDRRAERRSTQSGQAQTTHTGIAVLASNPRSQSLLIGGLQG